MLTKFNKNALAQDISAAYGGAGYALLWGFGVSASGLTLTVASGQAIIKGLVESTVQTIVLPSSSVTRLWLQNDGAITYTGSSIVAPDAFSLYIGCATTAGTSISQFDPSGVVSVKGGQLWRQTNDALAPSDSPPSGLLLTTQTSGGVYLWDGGQHRQQIPAAQMVFEQQGPRFTGGHLVHNSQTVNTSGGLQLTPDSPNVVFVNAQAASAQVILPPSGMLLGNWFEVHCLSYSPGTVLVMDGGTVLKQVQPNQYLPVRAMPSSGAASIRWPISAPPAIPN